MSKRISKISGTKSEASFYSLMTDAATRHYAKVTETAARKRADADYMAFCRISPIISKAQIWDEVVSNAFFLRREPKPSVAEFRRGALAECARRARCYKGSNLETPLSEMVAVWARAAASENVRRGKWTVKSCAAFYDALNKCF